MFRKIFWILVLVFGYIWLSSSKKEGLVVQSAKLLYDQGVSWLGDIKVEQANPTSLNSTSFLDRQESSPSLETPEEETSQARRKFREPW